MMKNVIMKRKMQRGNTNINICNDPWRVTVCYDLKSLGLDKRTTLVLKKHKRT